MYIYIITKSQSLKRRRCTHDRCHLNKEDSIVQTCRNINVHVVNTYIY